MSEKSFIPKPICLSTRQYLGVDRAIDYEGLYDEQGMVSMTDFVDLFNTVMIEVSRYDTSSEEEQQQLWDSLHNATKYSLLWQDNWERTLDFAEASGVPFKMIDSMEYVKPSSQYYTIDAPRTSDIEELAILKQAIPELSCPTIYQALECQRTPVVTKPSEQNRGINKFLLETPDQLRKFQDFIQQASDAPEFLLQDFIETPRDRYTSYRVLVAANGSILASALLYSEPKSQLESETPLHTPSTSALVDESNPHFLNTHKIVSNHAAGGQKIVLDGNVWSRQIQDGEPDILMAHGLDPAYPQLPDTLKQHSQLIGRLLSDIRGGLIFGLDFIQDRQGKYHFLEANTFPSTVAYYDLYQKLYDRFPDSDDLAKYYMTLSAIGSIACQQLADGGVAVEEATDLDSHIEAK